MDRLPFVLKSKVISEEYITTTDGAEIVLRRYGNPKGPRLIVSHGNGLAVDAFHEMWGDLAQDYEVVPLDIRNHGRNPLHYIKNHTQEMMVEDLRTILRTLESRFGAAPTSGLFHSISGVIALRLAVSQAYRFASLVLLEPPLQPPISHPLYEEQNSIQRMLVEGAIRRRSEFQSIEEFVSRMRPRDAFTLINEARLRGLAQAILRPLHDDRYILACPPEFEAKIYETNVDAGLWGKLPEIDFPVLVMASEDNSLRKKIAVELTNIAGFRFLPISDVSHLMPLERPKDIAQRADEFFQATVGA
ncbi:MAG: alpha/beta hydrolase [Alphaproteobacteria bacterium]